MKTKEQAEEVLIEIKKRLGALEHIYLSFKISKDGFCDGGDYYIRIE